MSNGDPVRVRVDDCRGTARLTHMVESNLPPGFSGRSIRIDVRPANPEDVGRFIHELLLHKWGGPDAPVHLATDLTGRKFG